MILITSIFTAFIFLFPLWVAIHAWRKDFKTLSVVIGISYFIPFLPFVIAVIASFFVKPWEPNLSYIPGPRLFIGWGTKFYCSSEKAADGSFITTQWFTVFYLPILPIQSYRIIMGESDYKWHGYSSTTTRYFQVLECRKLELKHILKVYTFILSFIPAILITGLMANKTGSAEGIIVAIFITYLIAGYFLLRAK